MENKIFIYKNNIAEIEKVPAIEIFSSVEKELKYTVGIVTYKRRHDLKEAIDSLLNQDCEIKYNLLVIDDYPGRDDETEQLITEEYSNVPRLTYLKNGKNLGQAGNWNRLFQFCQTKYLIMLHDDDVLFPSFLRRIDYFANKYDKVSMLNSGKVYWQGNETNCSYPENDSLYSFGEYTQFPFFMFGAPTGCLFNVNDVKEIGGFDPDTFPSIDYVFTQKMCMANKLVLSTKEKLMFYRIVGNASSKAETQILWLDMEYRIHQELSKLLNIPSWKRDVVLFFEMKWRLRLLNKLRPGYTYLNYKPGGKIFAFFYGVYFQLLRKLLIKEIL